MGANETWAKVIGVVLVLVGIWGFFTTSIFGLFGVNTAHNIVHIVTGVLFAWAGFAAGAPAKKVNLWLGVIYILVAIVGYFSMGVQDLLGLSTADHWLHLAIGIISAGIGWKGD